MSIEEVTAAINCLQDPNQTKHANAWLEIFSRTTGAWQTLDLLLSQSCGPQKTFISISLYRKVQRDFYQIHSFSTPEALLQSLMQHMVRLATETPMDMVACRYICLSVAAAAVQSGIPGIVNKLLGWLNPLVSVCPMVLLELITALPQECYNNRISVSRDVQDKFSEELYQNLEEVCNFLYFILTNFNDQNKNTKAILQSFEVWVAHTTGPEGLLFSHPLFKFAIENLCNIDVLEFSSKIISSILLNDGIENKLISGALLQYVLQTRSLWLQYSALAKANSQNLDDFEDELSILRHISILVSDTASAFMAKVEDPDDETQVSLSTYILDCASFYWDFNIARIPFNYFYDLSLNYKERNGGISDSRIGQIFTSLLEISVRHMALPAGSIVSSEEVSDVDYEKRGELLDTIGDCMLVLGPSVAVKYLCMMIQREMEQPVADPLSRLPMIESILFALQSIISDLPIQDCDVSAQLLSFMATIPESSSELKRTTIRLIGRIPHWTPLSSSIPQHLSNLVITLSNPKLSLCSAQAIMNICRACDDIQFAPFIDIAKTFEVLRQSKALPSEPESYLIEGLCRLVSRAPAHDQPNYLQMIVTPIESTLQSDLNATSTGQEVLSDVEAMTSLFKFITLDKSLRPQLVQYFSKIQPLLDIALKRFPTEKMSEEVCRCFRAAMRTCGSDFAPLIPSMATYLIESFKAYPFSAFIYATQECIVTSKAAQQDGSTVLPMIGAISEVFLNKMNSLDKFVDDPDLVEEYFFFISKTFEDFAPSMIHSSLMPTIVETAIFGLQLEHREAQKGILTFFDKMLEGCVKVGDDCAMSIVEHCAGRLISALVPMMSGSVHWFSLDKCAREVLHSLRRWPKFEASLSEAINVLPNDKKAIAISTKLLENLARSTDRAFFRTIEDFESKCKDDEA